MKAEPRAIYLPGSTGNYISTPDHVDITPSTELEVTARIALTDYTSSAQCVVAKQTSGSQRSFDATVSASGRMGLALSSDGSARTAVDAGVAAPFTDLTAYWLKWTWRASDGRVQFYWAADAIEEPTTSWVQTGTDKTIAIASIFDSTSSVEIGSRLAGTAEPLAGKVHRVNVKTTIGGSAVAAYRSDVAGVSPYRDTLGRIWTVTGSGSAVTL